MNEARRIIAFILLGFVIGIGAAAGIALGVIRGDTARIGVIEAGYRELERGFTEQQELIRDQRAIISGIENETITARGAINRAITAGGRATDRLQVIIEKMEILNGYIGRVERVLDGRDDNRDNEITP